MMHDNPITNDLLLFAVNTGELYATHKRLAEIRAPHEMWTRHIRHIVEPLYKAQVAEPESFNGGGWSAKTVCEGASGLKAYYEERVKES